MYILLLLLLVFLSIYLSINNIQPVVLNNSENNDYVYQNNIKSDLMLFLTQNLSRVKKNYSKHPNSTQHNKYFITGQIIDNSHVALQYNFPLVENVVANINLKLYPLQTSKLIDQFGVKSTFLTNEKDHVALRFNNEEERRIIYKDLLDGSVNLNDNNEINVDYNKLVTLHKDFTQPIAEKIVNELNILNKNSRFNKIQSALHFVQYIPYGIPCFDCNDFFYFGISLPSETLALNYSDCDSKSILFASILTHLIDSKDIILVQCFVEGENEASGNHMMVAINDLNIGYGQKELFNNKEFLLIETTSPCVIGEWPWNSYTLQKIITLA